MARTSKGPRYYKSKSAWYANLGGERILLARGPMEKMKQVAKEKYEAEVAARKVEVAGDRNTIWAVNNEYLRDLENRVASGDASPGRLSLHRYVLTPFNAALGSKLVRDLRPQHVTDWLATMRQSRWNEKLKRHTRWDDGTDRIARAVINRAFNWAVGEAGLVSANPLKRAGGGPKAKSTRRRPSKSRPAITEHEHGLLVEQASRRTHKDFLHLLLFLRGTGARPAEMYGVTAEEWDGERQAFRVKAAPENHGRYKLAHLGEDRFVYFPDDLLSLVHELMAQYPAGTLFRNERGKPWKRNTLCSRFTSIKRAANRAAADRGVEAIRSVVTAYSYRHAFVTDWVAENKPLPVLCELLNTSEMMVRKHYSHLFERTETLRDALNSFGRGTPAPPATDRLSRAS